MLRLGEKARRQTKRNESGRFLSGRFKRAWAFGQPEQKSTQQSKITIKARKYKQLLLRLQKVYLLQGLFTNPQKK